MTDSLFDRRTLLLTGTAVLTALPAAAQPAPLDRGPPSSADSAKLGRVSIMAYNFTSRLKLEGQAPGPDRELEFFDLADYLAEAYGVHNVELQHKHFASTEDSYLSELRARMEKARSRVTQVNVEFGEMTGSVADPILRNQAIDLTKRWVDHAVVLGCPRVMINQGLLTNDTKARMTASLRLMNEYAKPKGVRITVETREPRNFGPGGPPNPPVSPPGLPLSAPDGPPMWELVKEIVEASETGCNIDIGNITAYDQASLHYVLNALMPFSAGNVHIKLSPNWDLGTTIRYLNNDLAYKGLYAIEVSPPLIRGVYDIILANI